jgi:hypothetical protein
MVRNFFTKVLVAALLVAVPAPSFAAVFVGVSVRVGPPAIPYYAQPPVPAPGLLWVPGYWAWSGVAYYWVPGTWVPAPRPGYLWTPGYWAFNAGYYGWHPGYWGPHVGFYGGINYGYGYFGAGFVGGGWFGGVFRYNGAYTNVNRTIVNNNVYVNKTVVNNFNSTATHVSYNGGTSGVQATPTAAERAAASDPGRISATPAQAQHQQTAAENRNSYATVNGGHPDTAAVAHPLSDTNKPSNFEQKTDSNVRPNSTHSENGSAPHTPTGEEATHQSGASTGAAPGAAHGGGRHGHGGSHKGG